MAKTLVFEIVEPEATELESILKEYLAEMQSANEQMKQDQEEINRLKRETQAIAFQTRSVLEQLESAA